MPISGQFIIFALYNTPQSWYPAFIRNNKSKSKIISLLLFLLLVSYSGNAVQGFPQQHSCTRCQHNVFTLGGQSINHADSSCLPPMCEQETTLNRQTFISLVYDITHVLLIWRNVQMKCGCGTTTSEQCLKLHLRLNSKVLTSSLDLGNIYTLNVSMIFLNKAQLSSLCFSFKELYHYNCHYSTSWVYKFIDLS